MHKQKDQVCAVEVVVPVILLGVCTGPKPNRTGPEPDGPEFSKFLN